MSNWTATDWAIAEFALDKSLSVGEVEKMLELGLILLVHTTSGVKIIVEEGLSEEEFRSAWRALQRIKRK